MLFFLSSCCVMQFLCVSFFFLFILFLFISFFFFFFFLFYSLPHWRIRKQLKSLHLSLTVNFLQQDMISNNMTLNLTQKGNFLNLQCKFPVQFSSKIYLDVGCIQQLLSISFWDIVFLKEYIVCFLIQSSKGQIMSCVFALHHCLDGFIVLIAKHGTYVKGNKIHP